MIQVTKIVEWDMGHRVPNHKSKCRNPHGHRYRLEVTVTGDLNTQDGDSAQGMVIDFADVKRAMMTRVHDVLDHGYMVYEKDRIMREFFRANREEAFRMLVVPFVPTAENIARWCHAQLQDAFPPHVRVVNCRVFETPHSWADYQPDTPS
jgi:6-pyruvoyltetrahydropterin/6-carboxytetrahydropterin synthase